MVEECSQKKTQLEHILLFPALYIGSVNSIMQPMSIWYDETEKKNEREVTFVPGLFKIFDEIIINASAKKKKNKATPRWTNLMLRLMHLLTLFQSPIIRQRF